MIDPNRCNNCGKLQRDICDSCAVKIAMRQVQEFVIYLERNNNINFREEADKFIEKQEKRLMANLGVPYPTEWMEK